MLYILDIQQYHLPELPLARTEIVLTDGRRRSLDAKMGKKSLHPDRM